jgi:hypothetical protein
MELEPMASQSPYPPDAVLKAEGKITSTACKMPANKTTLEVMPNYELALGAERSRTAQ